jgi:hypothetical protein
MLPRALLLLLNAAYVFSQSGRQLSVNSVTVFNATSRPSTQGIAIPAGANLTLSIALCSLDTTHTFFVTARADLNTLDPNNSADVTEIVVNEGYGLWSGTLPDGGFLTVEGAGRDVFEVGLSDGG